jgi:hypothetical protein
MRVKGEERKETKVRKTGRVSRERLPSRPYRPFFAERLCSICHAADCRVMPFVWLTQPAIFDERLLMNVVVFVRMALLALALLPLAAGGEEMFVHGSWVNVRGSDDPQSAVFTHLVTNTKVRVMARGEKMCEIVFVWDTDDPKLKWKASTNDYLTGEFGFVACALLSEKPLTLKDTRDPLRRFWISPSAWALFQAGWYFQGALLPLKQQNLENGDKEDGGRCSDQEEISCPQAPLVRYLVPEFEAMKTVLAEGIVVEDAPLLPCLQTRHSQSDKTFWQIDAITSFLGGNYCQLPGLPELQLPEISPSYFRSNKGILPGNASLEWISAHFGIAETGRKITAPYWASSHKYDDFHYAGSWDIGIYELKLEKPVVEHVISINGNIAAYQWTPAERIYRTPFSELDNDKTWVGVNYETQSSYHSVNHTRRGQALLPGYTAVHIPESYLFQGYTEDDGQKILLWFQSADALPLKKASVSRRDLDLTGKIPNHSEKIAVFEVDLDHDGVADFVKWYWHEMDTFSAVFININGEWHRFEAEYVEPGC